MTTHDSARQPDTAGGDVDPAAAVKVAETKKQDRFRSVMSWTVTIALAVGLTIVVKTWFYQPYSIPSESMVPTLEIGDRVVVSKLNRDPGRGDIIVFDRPPKDLTADADAPSVLIKRVIGLPGDTVSSENGHVLINGTRLRESYLKDDVVTDIEAPIRVPPGEYLVLGDNRPSSQDGRKFGTIPKQLIVGRAILRIWPLSRFGRM